MQDDIDRYVHQITQKIAHLPEKVQEELNVVLIDTAYEYMQQIEKCESPIEQLLLMWLLRYIKYQENDFKEWDSIPSMNIEPQREVERGLRKYRIDIALDCLFNGQQYQFAIECDGHEFHEKTKEQAARDKKRERDLQSIDYQVIRFTGSEIWNRPSMCALQALKIVQRVSGIEKAEQEYWKKKHGEEED